MDGNHHIGAEVNNLDVGEAADRSFLNICNLIVVKPEDLEVGELLHAGLGEVGELVVGQVEGAEGGGERGEELGKVNAQLKLGPGAGHLVGNP